MKTPELKTQVNINEAFLDKITHLTGLIKSDNDDFVLATDKFEATAGAIKTLEQLFDEHKLIAPDPVLRPMPSTTIFTTAGVQHIETLEANGLMSSSKFQLAQPVIRSQYIDKIKDGFSTSFINYSIISTHSSPDEFASQLRKLIQYSLQIDSDLSKYKINVEEVEDRWGAKKFRKMVFTIKYDGIEISEGVLMIDYPTNNDEKIFVSDICFGQERLEWAHKKLENYRYFQGLEDLYKLADADTIAKLLDPIRTATLMLMQGVVPHHKDPGFRLRQLIKRFLERNSILKINPSRIVDTVFKFWKSNGVTSLISEDRIKEILNIELERAYNVFVVSEVEKITGKKIRVDVNKKTVDFLKVIFESAPSEIVDAVKSITK